jgi:hypothetical protein
MSFSPKEKTGTRSALRTSRPSVSGVDVHQAHCTDPLRMAILMKPSLLRSVTVPGVSLVRGAKGE